MRKRQHPKTRLHVDRTLEVMARPLAIFALALLAIVGLIIELKFGLARRHGVYDGLVRAARRLRGDFDLDFNLDIVVAVHDENPREVLEHLSRCCDAITCRVFVYSSFDGSGTPWPGEEEAGSRVDDDDDDEKKKKTYAADAESWRRVPTPYRKRVTTVNNSWGGGKHTAYLTYLAKQFDDMGGRVAFVHGYNSSFHVESWHSDNVCNAISNGLLSLDAPSTWYKYVNIAYPYPRRCVSRNGVAGRVYPTCSISPLFLLLFSSFHVRLTVSEGHCTSTCNFYYGVSFRFISKNECRMLCKKKTEECVRRRM